MHCCGSAPFFHADPNSAFHADAHPNLAFQDPIFKKTFLKTPFLLTEPSLFTTTNFKIKIK
jgi:hypothetical protein